VETIRLRTLDVLFFIELGTRRVPSVHGGEIGAVVGPLVALVVYATQRNSN
jgi:hypothetical protein